MRGVRPELKYVLMAMAVGAALASGGCSSSSSEDDATVKPGSGTIIGGKSTDPSQAAYASQMEQSGNALNAERAKEQAAMAAAQARTGGK